MGWWCKHDERVTPTLTDPIEGASQGFLNPSWTLKERETPTLRDPIEGASQGFLDPSWTLKERETLGKNVQIIELSKNQFACNSFEAFEELTRLHMRAENHPRPDLCTEFRQESNGRVLGPQRLEN